jgi:hypothetical protein
VTVSSAPPGRSRSCGRRSPSDRSTDFLTNTEVERKFFGPDGKLRRDMARILATDISVLAVPSPERALALDRAYLGLVKTQSFS